jgi:hypothetical protein
MKQKSLEHRLTEQARALGLAGGWGLLGLDTSGPYAPTRPEDVEVLKLGADDTGMQLRGMAEHGRRSWVVVCGVARGRDLGENGPRAKAMLNRLQEVLHV